MWEIIWSETSSNQMCKLNMNISTRVRNGVSDISKDPFRLAKRLESSSLYRSRIGDYRVILDIQQDKMIIFVVEVGLRKNIYQKS